MKVPAPPVCLYPYKLDRSGANVDASASQRQMSLLFYPRGSNALITKDRCYYTAIEGTPCLFLRAD